VELSYALALAIAAGGLVLALGLAERRRTLAIFTALGAKSRHMRAVIGSEAGVLTVLGLIAGAVIGAALSIMVVKVLTGVFDPPPSTIAIPWLYLAVLVSVTVGALAIANGAAVMMTCRSKVSALREL
jgi:putative ABC transport system permease protein